jgi:hypothetical protein
MPWFVVEGSVPPATSNDFDFDSERYIFDPERKAVTTHR